LLRPFINMQGCGWNNDYDSGGVNTGVALFYGYVKVKD